MDVSDKNLIVVGRISGTHGIKGQLRLHSYSGNLESLQAAKSVLLRSPAGTTQQVQLKRAAFHSGKFLLTLGGFDTIEKALGEISRRVESGNQCGTGSHFHQVWCPVTWPPQPLMCSSQGQDQSEVRY